MLITTRTSRTSLQTHYIEQVSSLSQGHHEHLYKHTTLNKYAHYHKDITNISTNTLHWTNILISTRTSRTSLQTHYIENGVLYTRHLI